MDNPWQSNEQDDLANPRPRLPLMLVGMAIALMLFGIGVLLLFLR